MVQQNLSEIRVEPRFLEEDIKNVVAVEGKDDSDLEAEAKDNDLDEEADEERKSTREKGKKTDSAEDNEVSYSTEKSADEQLDNDCVSERLQPGEEVSGDVIESKQKGRKRTAGQILTTHSTSGKFTVVDEGGQQNKKKRKSGG